MVLLALSAVLSAFGVEVLAFSLVRAKRGVGKAPGLDSARALQPKSCFAPKAQDSLSRGVLGPAPLKLSRKESCRAGKRCSWPWVFKHPALPHRGL